MTTPSTARLPFGALRHRNFRLFILGQFVSLSGTWMQTVAQGWLVLKLTNSPFQVGLVGTLGSLPILLFTLYGGVLADRVARRNALILLQSLMLVEALTLALLTQLAAVTVHWVMALALFLGTLAAFEVPIRQAFVIEMVGPEDLMTAIALNSAVFNVTRMIGPAIAGVLIASVGLAVCFFANAGSYLAVLVSLFLMRFPTTARSGPERPARSTFREGLAFALGQQEVRALLLLTAVFSIFGFSFIIMLPVLARDVLKTEAAGYGGLMSFVGVGAGGGALLMAGLGDRLRAARRGGARTLIRWAGLLFGLSLIAAALSTNYWIAAGFLALAGSAMVLNNVTTNTYLQTRAPDHLRGRLMGFYSLMVLGMVPLGSLQAGYVSDHWGVQTSIGLGGAVCLIGSLVLSRKVGRGGPE